MAVWRTSGRTGEWPPDAPELVLVAPPEGVGLVGDGACGKRGSETDFVLAYSGSQATVSPCKRRNKIGQSYLSHGSKIVLSAIKTETIILITQYHGPTRWDRYLKELSAEFPLAGIE